MLGGSTGWTRGGVPRRGVPFWEDNRSDGAMAPSWRDPDQEVVGSCPDLFPRVAIALTVGQSAAYVALPCHQKSFID